MTKVAKTKAATNYTDGQTGSLVAAYQAADSEDARAQVVVDFAAALLKTPASIRAKLVREGVYVAKAQAAKDGTARVTKEALVSQVAKLMGVSVDALPGLEKAGKVTLKRLAEVIGSKEAESA